LLILRCADRTAHRADQELLAISTPASWVRDATPSFLNVLRKWKSTGRRVRDLAGVDRRASSGTTSTAALIMELTGQECRAALLILAHARTSLACDVGSTIEDATVVRCRCRGAAR
jgi:hypothetical protein